ncbi:rod shape-determining protein [Natrinema gelatinilyticum]|uniref:rod shape-determining protein n=1 Tax=Natrinema gelatinilyticum TaxID=2961571 RepID=UPI0020C5587F|nr:rod shape-determining protein [Natrinema gelatinilyticum]
MNDADDHHGATDDESNGQSIADGGQPVPVGVKLGSTRTVIATPQGGAVQTEETLTCLATYEDVLTGEEHVLYGEEAAREYPDGVQYMFRSGLPENDEDTELAKRFFQEFIRANDIPQDSVVVYAIPTIDNERGLNNLASVIESSDVGTQLIRSYPESLCGAIDALGTGIDATRRIFIGINMGSTNLEACAYRRGQQLARFATGSVTGNETDRRITNYIEEETQGRVNVDTQTAREYKETHGDFENFEPFTDIIQQPGGGTHEFTIETSVMDALDEYVDEAVDELANAFLPQLANNHIKLYKQALDEDIVLTGGMACIPGLTDEFEARLSQELQRDVSVTTPDTPVTAAARGAQRIAESFVENQSYLAQ